jgi:hypothetical protein
MTTRHEGCGDWGEPQSVILKSDLDLDLFSADA